MPRSGSAAWAKCNVFNGFSGVGKVFFGKMCFSGTSPGSLRVIYLINGLITGEHPGLPSSPGSLGVFSLIISY